MSEWESAPLASQSEWMQAPLSEKTGVDLSQAPSITEVPGRFFEQVRSLPGFLYDKWSGLSPEDQSMITATAGAMAAGPVAAAPAAAQLTRAGLQELAPVINRVLGAGLGGFTGRTTGELQQDQPLPTALMEGIKSGADMASIEMAGASAIPFLIEKVLAPGAAKLSPVMKDVIAWAEQKGVPISASSLVPSHAAKALEHVTEFLLPGKLTNDFYRKRAVERFNQLASEEIPQMVGTIKPSGEVNRAAASEFARLYDDLERGSKGLRNEFLKDIGPATSVPAAKTKEVYDKILRSSNDAVLRDFATTKLAQIENGAVRAEDLDRAFSQAGRLKPKGDIDLVGEMKDAIKADFTGAGAPIDKFVEANETFRKRFGLFAGKAKSIEAALRKGEEPASLARDVFRSDNPALVKYARENMDPEVFQDLLTENIALMLRDSAVAGQGMNKAVRYSQRLPEQMLFDGQKLTTIIERNMPTLKAAGVPEETIKALKNFAELNKLAKADIQKFEASGSIGQTMMTRGFQAGAGYYTELMPLIFGSIGVQALAKSLMQPSGALGSGTLHAWLTRGASEATKKTAAEGLRLGGRAVFSDDE